MLEEDHRVVAANRRSQQTIRIQSGRRTDDPQSRAMRKQRRASLGVIDRAANVSAISRPDDDRRREIVVGAPAHSRELVAKLHVGGPDVIEELDLDYRLESTNGKTNRAPNDVGFSKWRIVHPRPAELFLQPPRDLEHATFALDLPQIFFA